VFKRIEPSGTFVRWRIGRWTLTAALLFLAANTVSLFVYVPTLGWIAGIVLPLLWMILPVALAGVAPRYPIRLGLAANILSLLSMFLRFDSQRWAQLRANEERLAFVGLFVILPILLSVAVAGANQLAPTST
jgi:hypothetical protein